MATKLFIFLSVLAAAAHAQRPFYAGRRPIIPEVASSDASSSGNDLGNRFAYDSTGTTTTVRLPIEALGDRQLVNNLLAMPVDKQPFWLLNWQALEAHRRRPQTFPQRPNSFIDFGGRPISQFRK